LKLIINLIIIILFFTGTSLANNDEKIEKIKRLNDAYKSGLISKDIFESSKKRIIDSFENTKINNLSGERPIAIIWENYKELISSTITFSEKNSQGKLNFKIESDKNYCTGNYSFLDKISGTWHVVCNNNRAAHGSLKILKNNFIEGKGFDLLNNNIKFIISR